MTISTQTNNVTNYLVPAAGQTHAVTLSGVFSNTPYVVDWRQFTVDNFPFSPQGVFIDNTQGTDALVITIQPLGYTVACPAGAAIQAQFPAPNGQTASITGNGQATCYFVDFPVLPSGSQVTLNGVAEVDIKSASNAASPVFVSVPVDATGTPYRTQKIPLAATVEYLSLTGALTTTVAPPANSNLRKMKLALSGNAAMAVAGLDLMTVTLNGVAVAKISPYIPAAAGTGPTQIFDFAFDDAAPSAGAAGTLVLTQATALTSGIVELNAYFD